MSRLGEHGSIENSHVENNNGVTLGKNSDDSSPNTQEYLKEALNPGKYKEQTIDYWLKDVLCLSTERCESLRTKLDFNERVSIKDLLNKIELEGEELNLKKALIILADESLNKSYYGIFEDYLIDKNIEISGIVSVEYFLELLSGFDKEKLETIADWAGDRLMHDAYSNFEIYCERNGKKFSNLVCYSTYLRLLKCSQEEKGDIDDFYPQEGDGDTDDTCSL